MARKATRDRISVLMIGPLPPPLGGCTLLFEDLISCLVKSQDLSLVILNSSLRGTSRTGRIVSLLHLLLSILFQIPRSDAVALHTTNTKLLSSGFVVWLLCCVFRRPLIIRKFGGPDHRRRINRLEQTSGLYATLASFLLRRVSLYLTETKESVCVARECGILSATWFANSRPIPSEKPCKRHQCRRFVFLGHVKPTKGINELIEASERISAPDFLVDVYGPLHDGISKNTFVGLRRVHYKGVLAPENILTTIATYDCLVLPTYHTGEGYPGVLLEAYSVGVPVLTTRWGAVPEIADEACGILVEPHNAEQLHRAMITLIENDDLYVRSCEGALKRREEFSSQRWAAIFAEHCRNLAFRGKGRN